MTKEKIDTNMDSHPLWIQELMDQITPHLNPIGVLAPIGCHTFYDQENDTWEISVFASQTEVLGGQKDGVIANSNFILDLNATIQVFDLIGNIEWQALPLEQEDELGSHISIEGCYRQHNVWLRILSKAPEQVEAGQILDAQSERLFDLW